MGPSGRFPLAVAVAGLVLGSLVPAGSVVAAEGAAAPTCFGKPERS